MDKKNNIRPAISKLEISINFKLAMESQRKRHHKIIHEKGAEFNEVYNFMLKVFILLKMRKRSLWG